MMGKRLFRCMIKKRAKPNNLAWMMEKNHQKNDNNEKIHSSESLYIFLLSQPLCGKDERFCCCSSDLYALWAEHLMPIQAKVTFVHSHYIYPTCDVRESHRTQFEDDTWEKKKEVHLVWVDYWAKGKIKCCAEKKTVSQPSFVRFTFCWKRLKHFAIVDNV